MNTVDIVDKLTSTKCSRDVCPQYHTTRSDVRRAVRAHNWLEKGQLKDIEPRPSIQLITAIEIVTASLSRKFSVRDKASKQKNNASG